MIHSYEADGYTLHVVESDGKVITHNTFGDGLMLVQEGEFEVDGHVITAGYGAELYKMHSIVGQGVMASVHVRYSTSQHYRPAEPRLAVTTLKPWGEELSVQTEERILLLKRLIVNDGHRTSEHFHREKEETMVFIDDSKREAMHVRPMTVHRITGPHTYFEGSTHYPDDVVRVSDDYHRNEGCC